MRYFSAWLAMLALAVANGAARDLIYGREMSELAAHQVSTAALLVLLGAVIYVFVRRHPPATARTALALGLLWTTLTLAFEFLFFHYAGGRSWPELLAAYDLNRGRVWAAVPLWITLSPYLFFRLRRR